MSTVPEQIQDAVAQLQANASPESEQPSEAAAEAVVEIEVTPEAVEPEVIPTVKAPNSWSPAEKERFSALPPEEQTSIAGRERDRDLNIRKGQDETAAQRKELTAQTEAVSQQKAELLKRLQATGPQKPSENLRNPEHEDYDTDLYQVEMSRFEIAQAERTKLEGELSLEDAKATSAWQTKEIVNYQTVLPEYVHPETGQAFRQALADYAVAKAGITMEEAAQEFPRMPAKQMVILNKARLYDAAIAKAQASKGKPNAKTLNSGASNPSAPVKVDTKAASKNWVTNRDRAAASALFAEQRKAKG